MKSPVSLVATARPLVFALCVAAHPTTAKASCNLELEPLTIDYRVEDERVVFDTSLSQLEALARAAGREAHLPLLAVYTSTVLYNADISVDVQEVSPGLYCGVTKAVRIQVNIFKRNIHVAREIQKNQCLLAAATEHARVHAQNERSAYSKAEATLRSRVLPIEPFSASNSNDAKNKFSLLIGAQVDAEMNAVGELKARANKDSDSPQNLARLRGACPDST